jgi:predicted NUDIX family NTP pyrophosphohydrolase
MPKQAAGLVMFRRRGDHIEVLLAHPGGPLFAKKDEGHWSIPKGELDGNEDLLATAIREFQEETSLKPKPPFHPLGSIKQKSGKLVHAWAFEGDCSPADIRSNTFPLEWPPKSGKHIQCPEIDRAEWFAPKGAEKKIKPAQWPLIERLVELLQADI